MTDKKDPQPSPASKSYDLSGDTTDFDPKKLQVHAFSLEFRERMSKIDRPKLDPRQIEDTLPPNGAARPPAETPSSTATTATATTATTATTTIVAEGASSRQGSRPKERRRVVAWALVIAAAGGYLWLRGAEPTPSRVAIEAARPSATGSARTVSMPATTHRPLAAPMPSDAARPPTALEARPTTQESTAPPATTPSVAVPRRTRPGKLNAEPATAPRSSEPSNTVAQVEPSDPIEPVRAPVANTPAPAPSASGQWKVWAQPR